MSQEFPEATATPPDPILNADRVREELLSVMNREIRTPANGIIGMSGLLLQTALDASQTEMARDIQRSAEHLLATVNDLLDFIKIRAGKFQADPGFFQLRPLIEETRTAFAPVAKKKHLLLACDIDPALDARFWGDDRRLRQVLENLVGNAIKFTARGSVIVTARATQRTADHTTLRVTVRDTGPGIPLAAQARLFEPFTPHGGAAPAGSSGLGLSLSRQALKVIGGEIGVTSEPGHGAEFWFTLELANHAPAGTPSFSSSPFPTRPAIAAPVARSLRLLVADDNEINRAVALRMLVALGHHVDIAAGGEEALRFVGQHRYDAIFMDCQMPGLDGFETSRRIRANATAGNEPRVRIIALTASVSFADRAVCFKAGMDDFVSKPIRGEDLRAALERGGFFSPPPAVVSPQSPAAITRPPRTADLIDLAAQEGLRQLPGSRRPSLLVEVLELFLETTPHELEKLAHFITLRDPEGAAQLAHSLAGSCSAAGARRMRQLLDQIAKAAPQGAWEKIESTLTQLNEAWPQTRPALAAEIPVLT